MREISKIIRGIGDSRIIVNLSGGMRAVIAYTLLSCMMNAREGMIIEMETEDLSGLITLDWKLLKLLRDGISDELRELLKAIASGSSDVKSLSSKLGKDESTVRRQLSLLKELGLIRVVKRKPLIIEPTELAELIIEG